MSEIFHFSPDDTFGSEAEQPGRIASEAPESHEQTITLMDTEAALLYAFEKTGLIKPLDEFQVSIERVMDVSRTANQAVNDTDNLVTIDEVTERRDDRTIASLPEAENGRNFIQQKITEMINERRTYTNQQEKELWAFGKDRTSRHGVPPVIEIIREMMGIFPNQSTDAPRITEEAAELAPDIYWMMLRGELEARSQAAEDVA